MDDITVVDVETESIDLVGPFTEVTSEQLFALVVGVGKTLHDSLESNEWVGRNESDVSKLRKFLATGYTVFSNLRASFDATMWKQQAEGKYLSIEPVRKQSEFKNGRPGRKAKSKAERLAEQIG